MELLRNETITAAKVTASNLVETAAAWSSGTTYALAALASRAGSAGLINIYESLAGSNTNHTPESSPAWWKLVQTSYQTYSGVATYADGDRVIDTATHKEYESLQPGNTEHALTEAAWWLEVGPTAPYRPFDALIQTQSSRLDQISYTLESAGRVDAVAVLNASAASVQVTVTDATDGLVYDQTIDMTSTSGIDSWAAYFREPIRRRRDVIFDDLPAYYGADIGVTLVDTGAMAAVGAILIGQTFDLGGTQYGGSVGIQDYSRKTKDDFGNFDIVERAFARTGQFTINVPNARLDSVNDLLTDYRATAAVWIASSQYGCTAVYGFVKDWSVAVAYPTYSLLTISFEGLT